MSKPSSILRSRDLTVSLFGAWSSRSWVKTGCAERCRCFCRNLRFSYSGASSNRVFRKVSSTSLISHAEEKGLYPCHLIDDLGSRSVPVDIDEVLKLVDQIAHCD